MRFLLVMTCLTIIHNLTLGVAQSPTTGCRMPFVKMCPIEATSRTEEMAVMAVKLEILTQFPAELMLSQWGLETGWGEVEPENNLFGLLGKKYRTRFESCVDYIYLLTKRAPFNAAWRTYQRDGDIDGFVDRIAPNYAEDPTYADVLKALVNSEAVVVEVEKARRKMGVVYG